MIYILKLMVLLVLICLCLSCQKNNSKTAINVAQGGANFTYAVEPQFEDVLSFAEGLAAVKKDGKWGFVNKQGKFVIEPKYDYASSFSDGMAIISGFDDDTKNFGFINKEGEIVIAPKYCKAEDFFEQFAVTGICDENSKIDHYTLINKDGKAISDDVFISANCMSEGLAAVMIDPATVSFVNKKGQYQLDLEDSKLTPHSYFSEDYAPISLYINETDSLIGYVDTHGKIMIAPEYDSAEPFTEGIASVTVFTEGEDPSTGEFVQIKRSGFINKQGDYLVDPEKHNLDVTWPYREGMARVFGAKKYYFMNNKGYRAFEKRFESAGDFSEGLAFAMESADAGYGFINKYGVFVIAPQFESAKKFKNGLAAVKKDGQWGFINYSGPKNF